jgi:hypothetical protein
MEALQHLQQMFNELKRQNNSNLARCSSTRWRKRVSTIEDTQPSSSSAPDIIYLSLFSSAQPSPPSEEDDLNDPFLFSSEGR